MINPRVDTLKSDVKFFVEKAGMSIDVRAASAKEVDKLSDVWECTHAVFLDENVALGVFSDVVDAPDQPLCWYVYTFIDNGWSSHNDTGEDRNFAEALADAVSMWFYMRTHQLKHGIVE